MSKHDDGGPAFPGPVQTLRDVDGNTMQYAPEGMSLLDWYAGQALLGIIAKEGCADEYFGTDISEQFMPRDCERAYGYAAAMIAEKRRREEASG